MGQSFEADATEIYCLKCFQRQDAVNLVDMRWKLDCVNCRFARHYPAEIDAVSSARRHVELHTGHAVSVVDPLGTGIRLIQHTAPTLDEAGF